MDKNALKISADIIQELDKTFVDFAQVDIGLLSETIENVLLSKIENVLTDFTDEIIPKSKSEYTQIKTIKVDSFILQIRIHESIEYENEILVGYFEILNPIKPKTRTKSQKIIGYGKYDKVMFFYPDNFNINHEVALSYIKTTIECCYSWLFQKVKSVIKENTIKSAKLYSYVKSLFPGNKELYNSIWLAIVSKEKAMYLLDDETVQHNIEKLKKNRLLKSESSLSQINELIKMKAKYEDTFVKIAATTNSILTVDPLSGKYATHSTKFAIGESNVYDRDACVMPILSEGKIFLFIIFPAKYKTQIEEIISLHRDFIVAEFLKFQNRISKLFKILSKQQNLNLGEIGNFTGNLLGGFFKAYQ